MTMIACAGCGGQMHHTALSCPSCGRAVAKPYAAYFSFHGRIGRRTYWIYYGLLLSAVSLVASAIDFGLAMLGLPPVVALIVAIVSLWPSLAACVKRAHDRGRSGWFILVCLIPVVGVIWMMIELGFLRGTAGENRFGQDPLAA